MSGLRISKIEKATDAQWDRLASHCDYATFFHTRKWAQIWKDFPGTNLQPAARYITFSDGVEVLLPMSEYKSFKNLLRQYVSTAEAPIGGWLSEAVLTPAHVQLLWDYISKLNIIISTNPYDSRPANGAIPENYKDVTFVLDLRPGFEALNKIWNKEHRSVLKTVRKAQRANITISRASSLEEWKEYYQVYLEAIPTWKNYGSGIYPWEKMKLYYQFQSPEIELWVAKLEGKIISGSLYLHHNKHCAGWHRASLKEFSNLGGGNLLDYELIKQAIERGHWWYDMGPSGGNEGIAWYKEAWGCEKREVYRYICRTSEKKLIDYARNVITTGKITLQELKPGNKRLGLRH